jgi:hypothetical protein
MVLVILNTIKFEAEKFETRTMPTPDLKSKEMIYWIKINTTDKRLVMDLQRFLEGPSQYIELHVPSAFIAVKTELESYRPSAKIASREGKNRDVPTIDASRERTRGQVEPEDEVEERFLVEIILRRLLPESRSTQTQSPYG